MYHHWNPTSWGTCMYDVHSTRMTISARKIISLPTESSLVSRVLAVHMRQKAGEKPGKQESRKSAIWAPFVT